MSLEESLYPFVVVSTINLSDPKGCIHHIKFPWSFPVFSIYRILSEYGYTTGSLKLARYSNHGYIHPIPTHFFNMEGDTFKIEPVEARTPEAISD